MAYPVRVNFYKKIYKDQTLGGSAVGALIEVGDTVYLKKKDPTGEVLETVVVTEVLDEGHTIGWNALTTGVRNEDIVGISEKHSYSCVGDVTQTIPITESDPEVKMALESVVISGGTQTPSSAIEESEIADGIEQSFVDALVNYLNGLLAGTNAYVTASEITGVAGTQEFDLIITGMPLRVTALTITGATVGTIVNT